MPRKSFERESRQRFILGAARRLFAEKGIENTSMEDIAAAADYTRRTLYAYFRSRDEICLLLWIDDLADRWAIQREAIGRERTGFDKLMAWARVLYTYSRQHPHTLTLQMFWDLRGVSAETVGKDAFDRFVAINDVLADGLREIFRLGVVDGTLRDDLNIDMSISQFLYALRAVLHRGLSQEYSFAQFDPDDYFNHYMKLVARSLGKSGDNSHE